MNVIQTKGLCKRYGSKNVVENLEIQVPEGAIYGFIGRNGAGKSTTQKMVCGLAAPSQGEIRLFGKPLDDPESRKKVGTLIEQPGIYPGMSTLENVILQGYNVGLENPKEKALEALEMVELSKYKKKKAKHLSLGMKQRLGLAISLLGEPKLLVLDEPINGLDPEGIVQLRKLIEKLNKEKGITIFMSSHILGELSKIATHYGIIKDGELVEQMTAEELAAKRKDYLFVKVEDAGSAVSFLKEGLGTKDYEVCAEDELHLFDITDTQTVIQLLSRQGLQVKEIFLHKQDLEEYFLELMGGQSHA